MPCPKFMIVKYPFSNCQKWNTETCPSLHENPMQLSIANAPHWIILNDDTVSVLADMCKRCSKFRGNDIQDILIWN